MGWQSPLECKPCYLLQRAGQKSLTNAEWKAFCGCWTSFMLSSASRLCKDLSTVRRIRCFLSPFSIFFMLRQLAGWPSTAGVFIQTDPGLSLTKSISLVVAYSLISPVSLSERRHLIPFSPSILWSHPVAGCLAAPSPLMEYGPIPSLRYPSKIPLH